MCSLSVVGARRLRSEVGLNSTPFLNPADPEDAEWSDPAPGTVTWLRRHQFEIGIPYSRERLEKELDAVLGEFE